MCTISTIRVLPIGFVLAALGLAAPASAQIFTWRDANGMLVLSDKPPTGAPLTFPVERAPAMRVTKPVARASADTYDALIAREAARQAVPADLVRAVVQVESGFDPGARSSEGAMGLMQLMPATAADLGVLNPYDPAENVRGGVAYLRQLLDRFDGNEELALAAYNAGPETVTRYGNQVPPYRETRDYVQRVTDRARLSPGAKPGTPVIYRTVEIIDGRPVPKYSTTRPPDGVPFDVIR